MKNKIVTNALALIVLLGGIPSLYGMQDGSKDEPKDKLTTTVPVQVQSSDVKKETGIKDPQDVFLQSDENDKKYKEGVEFLDDGKEEEAFDCFYESYLKGNQNAVFFLRQLDTKGIKGLKHSL
jgi:hypothetical protein